MPRAIHVPSGTSGAQAVAAAATVVGYSVRETAGTAAAATVIIRNGTTDSDPAVALIELAADGSKTEKIAAIDCAGGVFVDRAAGSSEIVVYVL